MSEPPSPIDWPAVLLGVAGEWDRAAAIFALSVVAEVLLTLLAGRWRGRDQRPG